MIIPQDINIKDRKSLAAVRQHLRSERIVKQSRVDHTVSQMRGKWNASAIAERLAMNTFPQIVGKALGNFSSAIFASEKAQSSSQKVVWKEMLVEAIQTILPRLIQRI